MEWEYAHDPERDLKMYVFDIPKTDYIAALLKEVPVFTDEGIGNAIFIINRQQFGPMINKRYMHWMYLIHKLGVRPPL